MLKEKAVGGGRGCQLAASKIGEGPSPLSMLGGAGKPPPPPGTHAPLKNLPREPFPSMEDWQPGLELPFLRESFSSYERQKFASDL